MIIWWSGRGILSIIVLVVTFLVCINIFPAEYGDYVFAVTAFVSGVFCWYFGKKWNTKKRVVIDEKTGQQLKVKNKHTLFFIPMQYWGILFLMLGVFFLFIDSKVFGTIAMLILLAFILIPLINKKTKT